MEAAGRSTAANGGEIHFLERLRRLDVVVPAIEYGRVAAHASPSRRVTIG